MQMAQSISRWTGPLVSALLLCACSHAVRTNVDYRSINDSNTKHYELREEQSYTIPAAVENLPPDYPADMVALHLQHVDVRVKVIVNEKGTVTDARFSNEPAEHPAAFDDAVRGAVLKWHYTPFVIRTWEDIKDAEGNVTDSRMASQAAQPFSLDYDFSFDLRDGKPVVASNRAH
jgi:TonB family protein